MRKAVGQTGNVVASEAEEKLMMTAARAGWLTASLMTIALAGCATTRHGGLDRSADRLDQNAQVLAQDAEEAPHGYSENSSYTEEARDFADRAHEFHRAVEDADSRDADNADLKASFDELSRSYHSLRDDVEHSDDEQARHDLQPVTQAYLDVEDDMGGAGPSRYSESDYDRGPG